MLYINNIHITQFEKWDNTKDYEKIFTNLITPRDRFWLMKHIKMTTPVFGEWNIVLDNKLPEDYINFIKN